MTDGFGGVATSFVFVYSPSAHTPNAGLGHGCASTPANARPPHLSSFGFRLSSKSSLSSVFSAILSPFIYVIIGK